MESQLNNTVLSSGYIRDFFIGPTFPHWSKEGSFSSSGGGGGKGPVGARMRTAPLGNPNGAVVFRERRPRGYSPRRMMAS